jgi:hypothetical protein
LVEFHILYAKIPLEILADYINRAFEAFEEQNEEILVDYQQLNLNTFPTFFKVSKTNF